MHSTSSASDKVCQLLAHGRWLSPGTPASSITKKNGRHDIAEILLKVALNTKNQSIESFHNLTSWKHLTYLTDKMSMFCAFLIFSILGSCNSRIGMTNFTYKNKHSNVYV